MRVGFTGTRRGMTDQQRDTVRRLLAESVATEAHHGDCVGADADFHALARELGALLIIHPPDAGDKNRAHCQGDRLRPALAHLARNLEIVDETEVLIATPRGFQEELRSGTWACTRYGRKQGRPVKVVWPDGTVKVEGPAEAKGDA